MNLTDQVAQVLAEVIITGDDTIDFYRAAEAVLSGIPAENEEWRRALESIASADCENENIFGQRCWRCGPCIAKEALMDKCLTCGAPIYPEQRGYCDVDCAQYPGTPKNAGGAA